MVIRADLDKRLESDNDEVFKQAFEELKEVFDNLPENVKGCAPETCYRHFLRTYKPRYNLLTNQTNKDK